MSNFRSLISQPTEPAQVRASRIASEYDGGTSLGEFADDDLHDGPEFSATAETPATEAPVRQPEQKPEVKHRHPNVQPQLVETLERQEDPVDRQLRDVLSSRSRVVTNLRRHYIAGTDLSQYYAQQPADPGYMQTDREAA